jgi:hypothetical protein
MNNKVKMFNVSKLVKQYVLQHVIERHGSFLIPLALRF